MVKKGIGLQSLGVKGNKGYSIGSEGPITMKNTGGRFKEIVKELKGASKMHLKQSQDLSKMAEKDSPLDRKLTASCKSAAKKKFDVYPSAYANMWASKQQGKGKC